MIKKTLPFILGFSILLSSPMVALGAGLIPDCNKGEVITTTETIGGKTVTKSEYANPCNFNTIMEAINNIITFLLTKIITPLFALILVYVGWLYLSDMGSSENKTKAKKILKNAVIGFVIALAAWLIVKTILVSLGFTGPMFLS